MNTPGFTAEASLYKSDGQYRMRSKSNSFKSAVEPARRPGEGPPEAMPFIAIPDISLHFGDDVTEEWGLDIEPEEESDGFCVGYCMALCGAGYSDEEIRCNSNCYEVCTSTSR